jgi:hypothetical protein
MEEGVPVVRDRWETTTTVKAAITSAMQRLDATSLSGPEPEQHCRAVLAELAETVAPIKQRWAEFAAAQLPESGDLHAALEALAKAEKVANGPVTPGSDDEPGTVAQVVDLISEAHAAVTNALRHIGRPAEAIDDDASSRRLGAELDEMLAERASGPSGPESPPWSLPRGVPPGPKIAEPPPMYDRPPGPGFDHPLAAPESRSAGPAPKRKPAPPGPPMLSQQPNSAPPPGPAVSSPDPQAAPLPPGPVVNPPAPPHTDTAAPPPGAGTRPPGPRALSGADASPTPIPPDTASPHPVPRPYPDLRLPWYRRLFRRTPRNPGDSA